MDIEMLEQMLEAINKKIAQHEEKKTKLNDGTIERVSETAIICGLVESKSIILDIFTKGVKNV